MTLMLYEPADTQLNVKELQAMAGLFLNRATERSQVDYDNFRAYSTAFNPLTEMVLLGWIPNG